mgnify:CR=1 FL=1
MFGNVVSVKSLVRGDNPPSSGGISHDHSIRKLIMVSAHGSCDAPASQRLPRSTALLGLIIAMARRHETSHRLGLHPHAPHEADHLTSSLDTGFRGLSGPSEPLSTAGSGGKNCLSIHRSCALLKVKES